MTASIWRRHRASILLGLLGAGLLTLLLLLFLLFVAGMSHCSACDMSPFLLRGLGFSLLVAALFGLAVGLASAGLRSVLGRLMGARAATAVLVLLTMGGAILAAKPAIYSVEFLEYRLEKMKLDAERARLSDLCPDRSRHLSIIHDSLPRPLPPETFVAEVRFAEADVTALHQGGVRAEVRRVIQGDPAIRWLIVERVPSDRCDRAFENGREGLAVMIPFDRARGDTQKVHPIFVRRSDGYRLPDGYRIAEWERPYWLRPPPAVSMGSPHARSVTHAANGIAVTAVSPGEAIAVPAPPPADPQAVPRR